MPTSQDRKAEGKAVDESVCFISQGRGWKANMMALEGDGRREAGAEVDGDANRRVPERRGSRAGIYLWCPAWTRGAAEGWPGMGTGMGMGPGPGPGLEGKGPSLSSSAVTRWRIVSNDADDKKNETRTTHSRSQCATPIPGRRCAGGQTAMPPVSPPCVALRGFGCQSQSQTDAFVGRVGLGTNK